MLSLATGGKSRWTSSSSHWLSEAEVLVPFKSFHLNLQLLLLLQRWIINFTSLHKDTSACTKEPISLVCASHLEHLPCDELMTCLTLNAKMDLVVLLTVGGTVPERRETNVNTRWNKSKRGFVWTSCTLWLQLIWATYLLMYSPVSTLLQALHLKQPRCHCLSNARRACPFLMSRPHPAQSMKSKSAMALKVSKQWGNACRVNKCFFSLFPVKHCCTQCKTCSVMTQDTRWW